MLLVIWCEFQYVRLGSIVNISVFNIIMRNLIDNSEHEPAGRAYDMYRRHRKEVFKALTVE